MSLLEDIRADREQTDNNVRSMAQLMLLEMCCSIKDQHRCRPVVAAIVGDQTELHFPVWRNLNEKRSAFAVISQNLAERHADGTIVGYGGTINADSDSPLDAVILMLETQSDRVMMVRPYRITEDDVEWTEPFVTTNFDSPLTNVFCAN